MSNIFFQTDGIAIMQAFSAAWKYLAPALAFLILWRCAKPLLRFRREPELWGWLVMDDGQQLPIHHWENIIGRGRGSDIILNFATVSRSHAVLTRYDDGSWSVTDIGERGAVLLNGQAVVAAAVHYGDCISLGGVNFRLAPVSAEEAKELKRGRTRPVDQALPSVSLLLLTLFQFFAGLRVWMVCKTEYSSDIFIAFAALIAAQWLLFFMIRLMGRSGFEMETLAFFLCTLGLGVIASDAPQEIGKQVICIVGGIVIYFFLSFSLRNTHRAKIVRYGAAVLGVLLLAYNLVFGQEINGARNWIALGSMSFQPSELVKLCFIFVGASTMDRIVSKRNVFSFIVYSVFICACLVLMNDFGTALIFFITFLVAAYLRLGSVSTIALALVALAFAAAVVVLYFGNHVQSRFEGWGHVWDYPYDSRGYQQTRAMIRIAAGGLFGLGPGSGWLKAVAASDTDLVFAFISEEWGFLMAVIMVLCVLVPTFFVVRSVKVGRSSFFSIAACAAAAVMTTQAILNVFGTMDLLPLTGVTFPFVSNGGSSMLCCWGLVAFIKAADTRQSASVSVKQQQTEVADDE